MQITAATVFRLLNIEIIVKRDEMLQTIIKLHATPTNVSVIDV